ncbi:PHD finger protein 7-like [Podargus strigoides]
MLCGRAEDQPDNWGRKIVKGDLCVHELCLIFSSELPRNTQGGAFTFLTTDIQREIEREVQKHCFVCSKSGARINCQETGCERSFHLPCAEEGGCITQFLEDHRSFCGEHRPEQKAEATPEEDTNCLICLEPVGDRKSYSTLVCPACKHAWFHRGCIQAHALCAGATCFQCPLCRDRALFIPEMLYMGIRIPRRAPRWEIDHMFDDLSETHRRCDTRECLCPGGREHVEAEGCWELFLCHTCSAEGTHRACSDLSDTTYGWECGSCAGLDTGPTCVRSRARLRHRARSPYELRRRRSDRSREPAPKAETSTPSQAALKPSQTPPGPETSGPITHSQLPSRPSSSPPALESGSRPTAPGPVRRRDRSHLRRQAQNPYGRPGHRRRT